MPNDSSPTVVVRVTPRAGVFCAVACDAASGDFVRRSHPLPDVAERIARDALAGVPTVTREVMVHAVAA